MKRIMTALSALGLLVSLLVLPAPAPSLAAAPVSHPKGIGSHLTASALSNQALVAPCDPASACYYYGTARQNNISPQVTELSWVMSVDDPWISTGYAYHTLQEATVQSTNNNSGNIIEWGWTKDNPTLSGVYADSHPRLFASIWKAGVWQGYNVGFTDLSTNPINLGADISSAIDTSKTMSIRHIAASGSTPGKWWLYYDTAYVASVPDSAWAGSGFTSAPVVQVFGEVAAVDNHPCTDMGSAPAVLPTATGTAPAQGQFASVTYNGLTAPVNLSDAGAGAAGGATADPTKYLGVLKTSATPRTVNVGGPGFC